jgi:putative FmdB family regulatory protein
MPVYEYRCVACGATYDVFHRGREVTADIICPACHSVQYKKLIAQYSASDVAGRLTAKDPPVLLDVRSAPEHAARAIGGSVHIPLPELSGRIAELERFRDREIICYCASGARSASAAHLLKKRGFAAANLAGGISGWREGR